MNTYWTHIEINGLSDRNLGKGGDNPKHTANVDLLCTLIYKGQSSSEVTLDLYTFVCFCLFTKQSPQSII